MKTQFLLVNIFVGLNVLAFLTGAISGLVDGGYLVWVASLTRKIANGMVQNPAEYQTLIGGVIAFTGVMITVVWRETSIRRQFAHSKELDEERHNREEAQRRAAVRDALAAEVTFISSFLQSETEQLAEWRSQPYNLKTAYRFALPDRTIIYRNLASEITSLVYSDVLNFMRLYDSYEVFCSWIREHSTSAPIDVVFLMGWENIDELDERLWELNAEFNLAISKL